ncbi:Rhodanese-like protein [Hypoxylon fuscum]|nr:Rhodanese-like protein [Hypoxylon fuscum]
MATRRIALSAALRGSSSSRAPAPAPRAWRAAFGTASRAPRTATTTTIPWTAGTARPQAKRIAPANATGTRWSSESAAGESKIWSFEEIQALATSPGSQPKVTLIDTREPSELSQTGRIPGALNIPIASAPDSFHVSADEFADRYGFERPAADADDGAELVFYCKAGVRSRAAAQIAREAGYKKVGEYPGSWLDWVEKGGKIER